MKSYITIFVMALMLCGSAMAIGDHAGEATYDADMDVKELSWFERLMAQ